jgi:Phage tail protein.
MPGSRGRCRTCRAGTPRKSARTCSNARATTAHGQRPSTSGSGPLTLGGTVTAPDQPSLDDARERLLSAASLPDTTLVVYETAPKQTSAHRSGKPLWAYVTDRIATFSVLLTAQDPRRYDVNLQTGTAALPVATGGRPTPYTPPYTLTATTVSGQVDAVNSGTFETRPVIVIDGPVSQPQVLAAMPDGSVRPMSFSQDLGTGDELVIDVAAKSVVLNDSVSRRRFLSLPLGWPVIPAQSTVSFSFAAVTYSASALLTVQWRSAWI